MSSRVDRPESLTARGILNPGSCSASSFMRILPRTRIVTLVLTLLLLPLFSARAEASFADEYDDIRIIKSDRNGLVFEYLVPEPEGSKIDLNGERFDLMNVAKCGLSNPAGGFQVPVRRVIIAVPPDGEVQVEITDSRAVELTGINLAPAARVEQDENSPMGYRTVPSREKYGARGQYPERIVSFDSPVWLRNQRVVELEISPLQYDPAQKSVRRYSQITLSVSFRGSGVENAHPVKDAFESIYRNVLLNYEQSTGWRRRVDKTTLRKSAGELPFGYSDNWYKVTVRENGIYRMDRTMLIQSGVPVNSLDPRTIRLFSGGGKVLPLDNSNPFLDMEEMAILVSGEDDGSFDSEDYVLFFGWSPNDWDYDSAGNATGFHTNPFTNDNVFWLTFDPYRDFPNEPRRMEVKDGSLIEENPTVPAKFTSRIHVEQDNNLRRYSSGSIVNYYDWYWMETSFARLFASLPGALPEEGCLISVKHTQTTPSLWVNGEPAQIVDSLSSSTLTVVQSFSLQGGMIDTIEIQFPSESGTYLDWYQAEYSRSFECYDRQLLFESTKGQGTAEYAISGLYSSNISLFDVTDYTDVKKIEGVQIEGDVVRFQDTMESDAISRYLLVDESRIKDPVGISRDEISSLRDTSNQADFIVVTHPDFYDEVTSLGAFRRSFNQMSVEAVKLQDVYDEFSGGLSDPVAIRDFLKFAYQNWKSPAPAYVLLVGDGHYDFKDNLGSGANSFIPPFVPTWGGDLSVSDDHYVYFGAYGYVDSDSSYGPTDRGRDMVIGRWPVRTDDEVEVVLDKVIGYENDPEFGTWRNLITLVADDEYGESSSSEAVHTQDTEKLAKFYVPPSFNLSKIYLMEYEFDSNGEKPEAEEAIVEAFNSGALIVNYMGHGNPDVWAHEHVFKRSQDIPRLTNERKLPLVYTASCSIGLFFDPLGEAMGEQFLRSEGKGSVATISATWLVFPQANAELNFEVYDLLLGQDSLSVGEALFIAKVLRQPDSNDRRFILFGDPVMKLGAPRLRAELTEIQPDTISALSLTHIRGEVKNAEGGLASEFEGSVRILAFDSKREKIHTMPGGGKVYYDLPGMIMFKGNAQVSGGRFEASFVVPKDISYGGTTGRIGVYLEGQDQDGSGVRDSLVILGSDTTVIDTTGPQITVGFDEDEVFASGATILPHSIMYLRISDENGINLTGEVGHGITLVIDQDYQKETDLTESFEYDLASYQQGSLTYRLPDLSLGQHSLTIKAWDNANNSSVKEINIKVSSLLELELTEVMNYPNPFTEMTSFCYYLSQNADRVEIKIFTEAGRLIRHISNASAKAGYNFSTDWNGEDQAGDKVANGIYIYKITAQGTLNGERKTKEAYGKAVVLR